MSKPYLIGFHAELFEKAKQAHQAKHQKLNNLKKEAEVFIEIENEQEFLKSPLQYLESEFMKANPEAKVLGVKFLKLLELREQNLNRFLAALAEFGKDKTSLIEPAKASFEVYAENPRQERLHKDLTEYIAILEKLKSDYPQFSFNVAGCVQGLQGAVTNWSGLKISPAFIKNLK